ncbi:MAG: hypothetical protein WCF84_06430 [Anaerolineae bacterium]
MLKPRQVHTIELTWRPPPELDGHVLHVLGQVHGDRGMLKQPDGLLLVVGTPLAPIVP